MTDIKAILQETNTGKSQQRTRDQDSRDRLELSLVERTTVAEPANSDQKQRSTATNKEGEAEPPPGQARAGNQWKKEVHVRPGRHGSDKTAAMPQQSPGGETSTRCKGRNATRKPSQVKGLGAINRSKRCAPARRS
jgi:hypothetical protein